MRRSPAALAVSVALVSLIALPATAARRSALGGNILIEDVKDVFFLPHEVTDYVNYVWFDFLTGGVSGGAPVGSGDPFLGSGGILFGNAATNDFGIGLAVHRSDYQGAVSDALGLGDFFSLLRNNGIEDLQDIYDVLGDTSTVPITRPDTLNWLDILAGFKVSNQLALGIRLSLGADLNGRSDRGGDFSGDPDPETSASNINAVISLGYTGTSFRTDVALEFGISSFSAEFQDRTAGTTITDDASALGIGAAGRAYLAMSDDIELGMLAFIVRRSRSTDLDDPLETRLDLEVTELRAGLGAGPLYHISEEALISAYATLALSQVTTDPENRNNLTDVVNFILPGITISGEWHLAEWFTYRAGLVSQYILVSEEQQTDPALDPTEGNNISDRNLLFYWATGIGISALEGDFNFDAMLNWPIITAGPGILSGQANDIFAMVSAGYSF